LTGKVVTREEYKAFEEALQGMGASFRAQKARTTIDGDLQLYGCQVSFDPWHYIRPTDGQPPFDEAAHWQNVLKICRDFGFQPV
jgi:hypothetical protein